MSSVQINLSDIIFSRCYYVLDEQKRASLKEVVLKYETAQREDTEGNYKQALQLYTETISTLLLLIKAKNLPYGFAKKLRDECSKLLTRAEHIKKIVQPENQFLSPSESSSSSVMQSNNGQKHTSEYMYESAITFDDVAGCEYVKTVIKECVHLPLLFPHIFEGIRRPHHKCFLLYGPPGCGKTFFSKAVCNISFYKSVGIDQVNKVNCYRLNMYDLYKPWNGDCERIIRDIFHNAHMNQPAIVIIDDVEIIYLSVEESQHYQYRKRRILCELMVQIDGFPSNSWVFLISQTPWNMEYSFRRRVGKKVFFNLPDHQARKDIFRMTVNIEKSNHVLTDLDFEDLAVRSKGFSPSDIICICKGAMLEPVCEITKATHFKKVDAGNKENGSFKYMICDEEDQEAISLSYKDISRDELDLHPITMEHFLKCLSTASPTVTFEELQKYKEYQETYSYPEEEVLHTGKKNVLPLQTICSQTIAKHVCDARPPVNIDMVIHMDLPLPKKLTLMVQRCYAEKLPFEAILCKRKC